MAVSLLRVFTLYVLRGGEAFSMSTTAKGWPGDVARSTR